MRFWRSTKSFKNTKQKPKLKIKLQGAVRYSPPFTTNHFRASPSETCIRRLATPISQNTLCKFSRLCQQISFDTWHGLRHMADCGSINAGFDPSPNLPNNYHWRIPILTASFSALSCCILRERAANGHCQSLAHSRILYPFKVLPRRVQQCRCHCGNGSTRDLTARMPNNFVFRT